MLNWHMNRVGRSKLLYKDRVPLNLDDPINVNDQF